MATSIPLRESVPRLTNAFIPAGAVAEPKSACGQGAANAGNHFEGKGTELVVLSAAHGGQLFFRDAVGYSAFQPFALVAHDGRQTFLYLVTEDLPVTMPESGPCMGGPRCRTGVVA
jgi:hypothetical protein